MATFSHLYSSALHRELGTDDTTILFTTARRKDAINQAQVEFCELTECVIRRSTIAIIGGTGEYDLNSTVNVPGGDFLRLAKDGVEFIYTDASSNVTWLTGDDLTRRDIDYLNKYEPGWQLSTVASSVAQLPTVYYLREDGPSLWLGFTLGVPSTGSSATASVRVNYVATPADLTADTSEPFTVNSSFRVDLRPYHQALVHYAAAQLEKLRKDTDASARQFVQFQAYIARYMQGRRVKGGRTINPMVKYFNRRWADSVTDPRR